MREKFSIINDLTEDEEKSAKEQVSWAITQRK